MVNARLKRSSGHCVKINMAQKELGRLRPDGRVGLWRKYPQWLDEDECEFE